MRFHAISCDFMRFHAISCDFVRFHAISKRETTKITRNVTRRMTWKFFELHLEIFLHVCPSPVKKSSRTCFFQTQHTSIYLHVAYGNWYLHFLVIATVVCRYYELILHIIGFHSYLHQPRDIIISKTNGSSLRR